MKLFIKQSFEPQDPSCADAYRQGPGVLGRTEYDALEMIPQAGAIVESNEGVRMIVPFENILAMEEPTFDDED